MAVLVAEFFEIAGLEAVPPQNLAELIPYLLRVVVGVCLVSGVFGAVGRFAEAFSHFRRW